MVFTSLVLYTVGKELTPGRGARNRVGKLTAFITLLRNLLFFLVRYKSQLKGREKGTIMKKKIKKRYDEEWPKDRSISRGELPHVFKGFNGFMHLFV